MKLVSVGPSLHLTVFFSIIYKTFLFKYHKNTYNLSSHKFLHFNFQLLTLLFIGLSYAEPEPEAKADPQLLYGGVYPFASYGLGYPYGYRFIGKREAEPEAKADPQYYGGYPYYPYSVGYPYLIGK